MCEIMPSKNQNYPRVPVDQVFQGTTVDDLDDAGNDAIGRHEPLFVLMIDDGEQIQIIELN